MKPNNNSYRAFAFDGYSSGHLDHIVWYMCGGGLFCVLRRQGRDYDVIFDSSKGIGAFDFSNPYDYAIAYDWDKTHKQDHILCYRPAGGKLCIFSHDRQGKFTAVFQGPGLNGEWHLDNNWWRIFAFDFEQTGKMDHLCVYHRWVDKRFGVVRHEPNNTFSTVESMK